MYYMGFTFTDVSRQSFQVQNLGWGRRQGGWDLHSLFLGSRIREPKPRGFDSSIRMVGSVHVRGASFFCAVVLASSNNAIRLKTCESSLRSANRTCLIKSIVSSTSSWCTTQNLPPSRTRTQHCGMLSLNSTAASNVL